MQDNRQTQLLDDNRRRIPRIKLIPSSNLESLSKHYTTPDSLVYCQHNHVSITPHYSLIDEEFIMNLNAFHAQIKYHSGAGIKRLIFDWNNADMSFNQPNGECSIFLNNLFGYKYQPAFSNLSDLTLILEAKPEAVDDLIPIIQAVGKNLGSLRAFTFEFSPFAMTNQAFKKLGSTISYYLPDLVYLHFKLIGSDVIDDEGLEYFLTQIHRRLHNLKYLGLELDLFPEVTDKCVEMFGHLINSEKSQLEGFKLGIWNCWKVGYDTIIKFLRSIKHPLPHLRECALKFSNTTDQGLEALGSYLSDYFTHLKILSLDFSDCEGITSNGLSVFGSKITGHLDGLEHLALNFSISESRVDDDFRVIGYDILLGLPSLKILDLDFNTCPEISDDGLEILGFVILPKLANLTRFRLSLSKVGGYKGITDRGFKLLAGTIAARLKKLQELILELDNCEEITDEGFQEAVPRLLLEIKTLKDLKLCPGISDNGLEAVASRIAGKSSSIEELTLRISGCNPTQEFQENIKRILS